MGRQDTVDFKFLDRRSGSRREINGRSPASLSEFPPVDAGRLQNGLSVHSASSPQAIWDAPSQKGAHPIDRG